MIITLQQIRAIAQDIRLNTNTNEDKGIRDFKLRDIEDICTKAIILLNEINNQNN